MAVLMKIHVPAVDVVERGTYCSVGDTEKVINDYLAMLQGGNT